MLLHTHAHIYILHLNECEKEDVKESERCTFHNNAPDGRFKKSF